MLWELWKAEGVGFSGAALKKGGGGGLDWTGGNDLLDIGV